MLKGWRTLLINIIAAILPVLQATGAVDLGLTGNEAVIYGAVVAAANFILRFFTTTPVGVVGK